MGYKYTVVREMSQEKDKCGRKVKEGANHNITPLLDSEVPQRTQKVPNGSPVIFTTASSSNSNACSPWMLSTNSFNNSSGCFCFALKLPFFGFLIECGMTGKGFVNELEDEEDFLLVDLRQGREEGQ